MPCFFIAPSERRIFANLSEPRKNTSDAVVLLCYPFGQEYMRAHRAYRQLATLLGRAGLYSMRFDYPSSGDSYGEQPLLSFDTLIEELGEAVEQAKSLSGKNKVILCGLRFGALVAAKLAQARTDIEKIFLWDAYANGGLFVDDCRAQLVDDIPADDEIWWVHGFPLTHQFRSEIEQFDLTRSINSKEVILHHVISHETPSSIALLESYKNTMQQHHVVSNGDWNYVDTEGSILMPSELVKQLSLLIAAR